MPLMRARLSRFGPLLPVAVAIAAAILPLPRPFVERWYSTGIYPFLQPLLTRASNAFRFAAMDVGLITVVVAFVWLAAREWGRSSHGRAAIRIAVRAATWAAWLYLLFLAAWGLNYRRVGLSKRLAFDDRSVNDAAAVRLAAVVVDRLNSLHQPAHEQGWSESSAIDPALAAAFERVSRDLGAPRRVVVGRPKRSVLDWYFERAGVAGMTDPFFLETLVSDDLLPFERPFVVAHEWSHLAGLADEGEANVAGWLTCLRASTGQQYSGWLFMFEEIMRAVPNDRREPLITRLERGPREDLRAIREREALHVNRRLAAAGWRAYDSYLKANRVEAGSKSYDEVVRLALGLRVAAGY
jgi:hypothetical protein